MENRTARTAAGTGADIDRTGAAGTPASSPAGPVVAGYRPGTAIAWCAGCRDHTEFVVPVGLPDASDDELACLYCGWAALVGRYVPAAGQSASAA